jgi:lipoyl(octanoyl) transferase
MEQIRFIDLGLKDYKETWDYQLSLHEELVQKKMGKLTGNSFQHLLFVEHPHVYTLGKSGKEINLLVSPANLSVLGAGFYKIDRGGDITYHGPGQLVGYPVFDLEQLGMGIKKYIHTLEETIITTLQDFGILSGRLEGATGVWIDTGLASRTRKICAIGVKVSRAITMHGFALNINTDLKYFNHINPCGFKTRGVTSMEKELGSRQDINKVKEVLIEKFCNLFRVEMLRAYA